MTSRCCWLKQPASATRRNCKGCESDGMARQPIRGEAPPSWAPSCGVDRVFGHHVSERTVETQLIHLFEKLGATAAPRPSKSRRGEASSASIRLNPGNRHPEID